MKLKLLILPVIIIFFALPITAFICLDNYNKASERKDFEFLSEPFVPIFEQVNEQLGSEFSYKTARISSGNLGEYNVDYCGDSADFTENAIKFRNMFSSIAAEKMNEHGAIKMKGEYIIKIQSSDETLSCWYNIESDLSSAVTDKFCDYLEFESLDGIKKLHVVTGNFSDEQKEYISFVQDKCSFKLLFNDKSPW